MECACCFSEPSGKKAGTLKVAAQCEHVLEHHLEEAVSYFLVRRYGVSASEIMVFKRF